MSRPENLYVTVDSDDRSLSHLAGPIVVEKDRYYKFSCYIKLEHGQQRVMNVALEARERELRWWEKPLDWIGQSFRGSFAPPGWAIIQHLAIRSTAGSPSPRVEHRFSDA